MKAAIVYDSGTHTTKKMKSWADVFVAYFQRGIKRELYQGWELKLSILL